jgi:hypothetical protein
MTPDHSIILNTLVGANSEIRFVFVAEPQGHILARGGSRNELPDQSVILQTERTESITSFYEQCLEYQRTNPIQNPQGYSQGRTNGVIGIPTSGFLLAAFGIMPVAVYNDLGEVRAHWYWDFRNRVWAKVLQAYGDSEKEDELEPESR